MEKLRGCIHCLVLSSVKLDDWADERDGERGEAPQSEVSVTPLHPGIHDLEQPGAFREQW